MVPTDDEHKDTPEVDSSASTKERKSGQLTPMPDYLMHWLTPVLFAIILLAAGCFLALIWRMPLRPVSWQTINPFWPPSWPFNYHWPSKDAMALCATIAGAGFAFSTWQQRSHDNAVREQDKLRQEQAESRAREDREKQRDLDETRRLKQIERDEYWKRREQIYQLLGSKNPGLRLSAVALLAELADSAAHSTLLNDTGKQQLQRHIIDTLCLQVRHEGLDISSEGTTDEHAVLQREIISAILARVSQQRHHETLANWSEETISINNARIITPLTISNTTIQATLDLSNTIFHNTLTIRESSIDSIQWRGTQFNTELIADNSLIKTDSLPKYIKLGRFTETRFLTSRNRLTLTFTPHSTNSSISFYECSFYKYECTCLANCSGESHANNRACTRTKHKKCACNNPYMFADVTIQDHDTTSNSAEDNQRQHSLFVQLNSCSTGALILYFHHAQSYASVQGNAIRGRLKIIYEENQHSPIPSTYCAHASLRFNIQDNTIIQTGYQKPIEVNMRPKYSVDDFIHINDNEYQTSDNPNETYPICCEIDNLNDQPFLFKITKKDTIDDNKIEWRTGGKY